MKKKVIEFIETLYLYKRYWKSYFNFFIYNKPKIKKELHKHNIRRIRGVSKNDWKIWYNTCYFKGVYKNELGKSQAFIKVCGPNLGDCFNNEKTVNSYIDDNSVFLAQRKPKLILNLVANNHYISVFDYINIEHVTENEPLSIAVQKALNEYSKIGILHTDFGNMNIGISNNEFCFFDYGTSLCPRSDKIRVRNSSVYNHLNEILPAAKDLIDDPDFYYDDAIHIGLNGLDRTNVNFLVGKGNLFFAKLGDNIYKYCAQKMCETSSVLLLHKI